MRVLFLGFTFCSCSFGPWGPVLCPCPVHGLVDIFEFLLRKEE